MQQRIALAKHTKVPVSFVVNGDPVEVLVRPTQTLLEVLRDELRLTGAKEGCGNGNCGACTVMVDGQSVCSCLVLGVEAEGHEITTIEGLARNGQLDPLQQAFIDYGALQCGICTPGFIMAARAYLNKHPNPTEHELRVALAGNLCRCTGYDKIIRAVMAVAQKERR